MTPESTTPDASDGLVALSLDAALTVKDLAASLAFYRDVLGFSVDREHRRDGKFFAVSMRAGAIRILLNQDDGSKGAERAVGVGFSLQITTAQDIDAIAARVRAGGITLDTEPTEMFGARVFRFRDPDGFRFAVSSPRAG